MNLLMRWRRLKARMCDVLRARLPRAARGLIYAVLLAAATYLLGNGASWLAQGLINHVWAIPPQGISALAWGVVAWVATACAAAVLTWIRVLLEALASMVEGDWPR